MYNIEIDNKHVKDFTWRFVENELDFHQEGSFNIGWYCSDRICNLGKSSKTALICEGLNEQIKKYTYHDLKIKSNTIAHFLFNLGISSGDRVCLFMDKIPELYIGTIAILKLGAIAQPLFSAFGEESLFIRLQNAQTKAIITQRKHLTKVRKILENCPFLEHVIVVDHDGKKSLMNKEISFSLTEEKEIENFTVFPAHKETPSILHYTSGTTGQPKGVVHVHSSLISQYITAKWVLDMKENDIYWCTADPGWVTGTSYGIIAPFSLGITQCVLDVGFSTEIWYKFIEKHKITNWYTAPTAIRSLMKSGEDIVKQFNLTSLRHLSSVGEPLNPEAVIWSEKVFGKPFHDTYWQTETGSMMICNFPGKKIKPGSMGLPFPGIKATVVDLITFEPYKEINKIGLIAFKPDWPALMRTYWNNHETYKMKFKNGWYISGDRAKIDQDGYFWFIGRDDDVINTAGHLVSPFEVESALLEHEAVAESAVTSKPDEINMEVVKAFIVLKSGFNADKNLELEIMNFIRKKLSPLAMPQEVEYVDSLPKTRSGKIMRRLLHAKEWGEEIGDISSLEND